METDRIYKENFQYAINKLKQIRDTKIARSEEQDNSFVPLFHCGDDKYEVYCNIVNQIEGLMINVVRKILYELLDEYKVGYSFYPGPVGLRENYHWNKIAFIINENDKRIGYAIYDKKGSEYYSVYEHVDEIRDIYLNHFTDESYTNIISDHNFHLPQNQISVSRCSIRDLFIKFFSEDEYNAFISYVDNFNEEANTVISYTTVVAPTEWAIEKFKNRTLEEIAGFDYYSYAENANIHDRNYKKLVENYIESGLYKIFISKEKFAESFIGSEWNYNMYVLTENLDMTGIVAGYIKSIEQLLYFIANYYIESGKKVKLIKPKTDEVYYYTNKININKTLGWLKSFVNNNKDLTYITKYVNDYTESAIQFYADDKRNPLSHKEIIKNINRVKAIREETLFLYFLILGSCKFTEEDISKLLQ